MSFSHRRLLFKLTAHKRKPPHWKSGIKGFLWEIDGYCPPLKKKKILDKKKTYPRWQP